MGWKIVLKKEIGFGELLGVCLGLAGIGLTLWLHFSGGPKVVAESRSFKSDTYCNRELGTEQFIAIHRIELVNTGDKPTSLARIFQKDKSPPAQGVTQSGKLFPIAATFSLPSLALRGEAGAVPSDVGGVASNHGTDPYSVKDFKELAFVGSGRTFNFWVERSSLPVNEPLIVTLGFVAELNQGGSKFKEFIIDLGFELAHGKTVSFQKRMPVPEPWSACR